MTISTLYSIFKYIYIFTPNGQRISRLANRNWVDLSELARLYTQKIHYVMHAQTKNIRQPQSFHNKFLPIHHKNEHISVMFFLLFWSQKQNYVFCLSFFFSLFSVSLSLDNIIFFVFNVLIRFHNTKKKPPNLTVCLWPI